MKIPAKCVLETSDGLRHRGILYRVVDDSLLCFRPARIMWNADSAEFIPFWYERDEIHHDTSLTPEERKERLQNLYYPDSFSIAFDSLNLIKFSVKRAEKPGEKILKGVIIALATTVMGTKLIRMDTSREEEEEEESNSAPAYKSLIGFGLMIVGFTNFSQSMHYIILPEKWKIHYVIGKKIQ